MACTVDTVLVCYYCVIAVTCQDKTDTFFFLRGMDVLRARILFVPNLFLNNWWHSIITSTSTLLSRYHTKLTQYYATTTNHNDESTICLTPTMGQVYDRPQRCGRYMHDICTHTYNTISLIRRVEIMLILP